MLQLRRPGPYLEVSSTIGLATPNVAVVVMYSAGRERRACIRRCRGVPTQRDAALSITFLLMVS